MPETKPKPTTMTWNVTDAARTRSFSAEGIPTSAQISEVVKQLVADLHLPITDPEGRPIEYTAVNSERQQIMNPPDLAGDAAEDGAHVELLPRTDAG